MRPSADLAIERDGIQAYAFFDLDGTLISEASVQSFFRFYLETETPQTAAACWQDFTQTMSSFLSAGKPRDEINAWFYRHHFAGVQISRIARLAAGWLELRCNNETFFKKETLEQLRLHGESGVPAVLVTGSFREVVAPIAASLGIETVLCAPLQEIDGRYTGALTGPPMIGDGKALAVERFLAERGVEPASCFGYGDDHTDIPFLERLGHPRALASGSVELLTHARRYRWAIVNA